MLKEVTNRITLPKLANSSTLFVAIIPIVNGVYEKNYSKQ